jgi:hypothetical protein
MYLSKHLQDKVEVSSPPHCQGGQHLGTLLLIGYYIPVELHEERVEVVEGYSGFEAID